MKDFLKLIFFGISKGPGAEIVLPSSGDRDVLRIGFNFQFFLFAGLFGIPLLLKGMWKWGGLMFSLSCLGYYFDYKKMQEAYQITSFADLISFDPVNSPEDLVSAVTLILSVVLGFMGNKWRAYDMFKKGWRFVDPDAPMSRKAALQWKFPKYYLRTPKNKTPLKSRESL